MLVKTSLIKRACNYISLALISALSVACSSISSSGKNFEVEGHSLTGSELHLGPFGKPQPVANVTRGSKAIESGAGLIGKALVMDPLVRPFSTIKAFYGVTLKSAGGFFERTFIEKVRMPKLENKPVPELSDTAAMDLEAWENQLDELTSRQSSSGRIRLLVDGDEYFSRLFSSIATAEESIDIRTYIYDNDDVALEVADLLLARSDEVEIKILVDGLADLFATRLDSSSMPGDTILPASMSQYLTHASKIDFRKQSNPWFTGDHAKITVIDQNLAFLGGMNIGREYRYDWHDLMMEVDGPIVRQLQYEFDQAWAKSGWMGDFAWLITAMKGYEIDTSGEGYPIRILSTSIHDSELYRVQLAAIRRARNHIYIENAYFSDDKILFELARARRRGVDVRVILASHGDSGILNLSNQKAINTMLRNGIRVYSYPGMTHVKAAVYDGWACLGSANFDKLSLQVNQEINLGTSHPGFVAELMERVFYPDFENSLEIRKPLPMMIRHHFAELIADEFL
ncbi:MAG: phosphatidylserine/phosphatidylglycerophosphate/cardiolipin synthase family protein [Gammaproteobacteria bacterium]|nr:phosphatidylserine/phosphatidylglycerophosphate/cardiolipin synthase family protein [Gammaproteobacteria bacterium]